MIPTIYDALKALCSTAWNIIATAFEKFVAIDEEESVAKNATGVAFTEYLLREILPITPEQQIELVTELATNKAFSKVALLPNALMPVQQNRPSTVISVFLRLHCYPTL